MGGSQTMSRGKQPKRLSFGRTRQERSGRWSAAYLHYGMLHRPPDTLWESETATDAEVRVMEKKKILETGANDPAIGYNKSPRWQGSTAVPPKPR